MNAETSQIDPDMVLTEPDETNDSGSLERPIQRPAEHRAAIERRISQTMPLYQGIMRRALDGTASKRGAIQAFCLHCVGDARADVAGCTAVACPLWSYRPYQGQK